MFDVITFGSAAWDVSLELPEVKLKEETNLIVDKGLLFNLGSKIDIGDINSNFGGGGINTATTFANQGFRTAYCGAVGDDDGGRDIIAYLKRKKINTALVKVAQGKKTNTSIVMKVPNEDRTILVYRGASDHLSKDDLLWDKLKAKWFYMAPLSGKLSSLTEEIIRKGKEKGVKIAINLGSKQLEFSKKKMDYILKTVDVLIVNLEEASILTGLNYNDEKEIVSKISSMRKGITVITEGCDGVVVVSDAGVIRAKAKKVKPVDNTGAGDAFGSGFISSLIRNDEDIESAIRLGMVNAKGCISLPGSTNGLIEGQAGEVLKKERVSICYGI
jgi:ribokinase